MGVTPSAQILPFDPTKFPRLGVKLSYFDQFVTDCGGRENLLGLTTTEVCERYVKPQTKACQSSYCDMLQSLEHPSVGVAQVFISHAWKYDFLDVANAVLTHFQHEPNIIIWFDLFSNNQHKAVELDFQYWSTTFQSAIQQFGRTVMVFAPWNNPLPLTRAWCLWELYCTANTGSKFEVAMTGTARKQFVEDMLNDAEQEINKMLATIDCINSECYHPADKQRIQDTVKATIGFSALNKLVFECLRGWVIAAIAAKQDEAGTDLAKKAAFSFALGTLYKGQGQFDEAQPLLESSYQWYLAQEEFGAKHEKTLTNANTLAMLYEAKGLFPQAISLLTSSLPIAKEVLGTKHRQTIMMMNNIALVYKDQGKYVEAEPYMKESYELQREVHGDKHSDTLTYLNNLALVYYDQGKYDEALPLNELGLAGNLEVLGDRHPNTVQSMNNLAVLFHAKFDYEKALPYYEQCLVIRKEVFGELHPETLNSIGNLAVLLDEMGGKSAEAQLLLEECLRKRTEILGKTHPHVLMTMNNLAVSYSNVKKYKEAEKLFKEAWEIYKKTLGEKHPSTLATIGHLAFLYQEQKRWRESKNLYEKSLKLHQESVGDSHPNTLVVVLNIAILYEDWGKWKEAEKWYQKCLTARIAIFGEEDYRILEVKEYLESLHSPEKVSKAKAQQSQCCSLC